ncbi:MAG: DUF3500 domain-containing protein [Verrucomicrobia bacterium]|nr:DUF3500 domain-containing protein [Verrucomicrobiota bacterium]
MRPTPYRLMFLVLGLVAALARTVAHEVPAEMLAAANTFLGTLNAEQKRLAVYPLTDAERENWNFVPIARNGLTFKKMTTEQYGFGMALLRSGLSHTGVARVQATMQMELVLKELEKDTPAGRRDPVNYFVTIFGEPSADKSWGWRFEGHHVAFNFTVVDGKHVFFTPGFLGGNPGEVRTGGPRQGERVLGEEEDLGHAVIQSLDAAQRKIAIFTDKAPNEIVTTNKHRVSPLSPEGITAAQLTPTQRERLFALVHCYTSRWRPELSAETYAAFTANLDKLTFAWAGATERGKVATYYRIQCPEYLIEFDNSQNNANHIHTTVRSFKGDFGADLLAEHYAKEHKK